MRDKRLWHLKRYMHALLHPDAKSTLRQSPLGCFANCVCRLGTSTFVDTRCNALCLPISTRRILHSFQCRGENAASSSRRVWRSARLKAAVPPPFVQDRKLACNRQGLTCKDSLQFAGVACMCLQRLQRIVAGIAECTACSLPAMPAIHSCRRSYRASFSHACNACKSTLHAPLL